MTNIMFCTSKLSWQVEKLKKISFFLGFILLDIHDSQDNNGSGRLSVTSLYPFLLLHDHLNINRVNTAESSPLHIATVSGNLFCQANLISEAKSLTTNLRVIRNS